MGRGIANTISVTKFPRRFLLQLAGVSVVQHCCSGVAEALADDACIRAASAKKRMNRNGFMLRGPLGKRGYDWWWHSFVARNKGTSELQPFFIEYYVVNPALGGRCAVLGQRPDNKQQGMRPSYAMIKAGTWRENGSIQINNFYGTRSFSASSSELNVRIGNNVATESGLRGSVFLSESDAISHPEFMSDAGSMSWDLEVEKFLSFDVGFGASRVMRRLNAFEMYWHVQGMKCEYRGTVHLDGEEFEVIPELSCGYQDKNWGSDYTNPWVWLNCNDFTSQSTGRTLRMTSLDVGGAQPVLFGFELKQTVLIAFYHEGKLHEFNFSKFWMKPRQKFKCGRDDTHFFWNIEAETSKSRVEIHFSCPISHMLCINYENPDGKKEHDALWNGGHASGTVTLHEKVKGRWRKVDTFLGRYGGCEYGVHDRGGRPSCDRTIVRPMALPQPCPQAFPS